jgi:uncharacterized protein (DUF58 family)
MISAQRTGSRGALLRSAAAIFPFSPQGLLLFLLAAILLASGLARSDLASLFWGASFLLYTLYAILASHFSMFFLKRTKAARPDFLTVILPPAGMSPDDTQEAHVSARLPRALAPGLLVRFSLPLRWHDRAVDSVACRLGTGATERSVRFSVSSRGAYRSEEAVLELRDVLGFTSNRMRVAMVGALTVHPAVTKERSWRILAEGEAPSSTTTRRRRSEELLEVRKYYPGDDARRLNWKVFAHSRELFLRVGEETPPPESRILFVLDTTENPLIPRSLRGRYLDALVDSCASAMDALLGDQTAVLLCRPGAADCRQYAQEKREEVLAALADQWWAAQQWQPPLPNLARLHAAVFSTPGSPGLPAILGQIRDRGWTTSLFLKESPDAGDAPGLRLRDLLFVPDGKPPHEAAADIRKARWVLNSALAQDLATYGSPGWKVIHVREI